MVDEGWADCPDCPVYGGFSYVVFEGGFRLISYDWEFQDLKGHCLQVKDEVEMFAGDPVFIMGNAEGYNYETYWQYCD